MDNGSANLRQQIIILAQPSVVIKPAQCALDAPACGAHHKLEAMADHLAITNRTCQYARNTFTQVILEQA